jgi:prepilin-type processing-associated H-X9-DG protein
MLVSDASMTLFLPERHDWAEPMVPNSDWLYGIDSTALWHNKRDNVLFADFHVEPVKKLGLTYVLMQK